MKNLIKLSLNGGLFELLKEFVKTIVRKVFAHVFRKQILEKDNKKPTLRRRRKQKGGLCKKMSPNGYNVQKKRHPKVFYSDLITTFYVLKVIKKCCI
ncbi:hypothetical protein BK753_22960 [Bacillus thuringiensis serovar canadensis]|nr:hypothetical protein BK753_22960 [Bacillus thuringiensis serovar canadensis]